MVPCALLPGRAGGEDQSVTALRPHLQTGQFLELGVADFESNKEQATAEQVQNTLTLDYPKLI